MIGVHIEDRQHYLPAVLVGSGVLLLAAGIGQYVATQGVSLLLVPIGLVNHTFAAVLGGAVVACGVLLARADISPARYPRAVMWAPGTSMALLALNLPMMAFVASSMSSALVVGWVYNVAATGAAAGSAIGVLEASAIERARAVEREATRADAAYNQTKQLDYLNSVLRHEVLNNANVISGYAELAQEHGDEAVADYLTTIQRQSEDMANVITDVRVLITTLYSQSGDSLEAVDLSAVLTEELAGLQATHDVAVEATIPDDVDVLADELLSRVFGNLLANAVEHNDSPTPQVGVTAEQTAEHVTVRIVDNGPGVPATERERLFERSERGDHGLGLYLVGELVERYSGRVELTETGSEGSVFTVTLPRAGAVSPQSVPDDTAAGRVPARSHTHAKPGGDGGLSTEAPAGD